MKSKEAPRPPGAAAVGAGAAVNDAEVATTLEQAMNLARCVAAQDCDRVRDCDVKNWKRDRIHAFIDNRDDGGLPGDAKAALRAGITMGIELIHLATPQKIQAKMAQLLGLGSIDKEAWPELLAETHAGSVGNLADAFSPYDCKALFLDEDILNLEQQDPTAWLAELESQGVEGLQDVDSAKLIRAKVEEIDTAGQTRAAAVTAAVQRLVNEAKAIQKEYNDHYLRVKGQCAAVERACSLLPKLWPLLRDGKLAKAVDEIEENIEAEAVEQAKKPLRLASRSREYAAEVLRDLRGSYRLDDALKGTIDKEGEDQDDLHTESKRGPVRTDRHESLEDILPQIAEDIAFSRAGSFTSDASNLSEPGAKVCAFNTDWGANYRAQLDMPETTSEERRAKYEQISATSQNFINDVAVVGKRIIEEIFIPSSSYRQLSFKPSSGMGGIAGGRKYVVNGILYKLASAAEEGSPYKDSFEAANKGAAHDLRGATALSNAAKAIKKRDPGAQVPHITLNALVDYLGFRLQAMPFLPLQPGSLKVGSGDAGDTIKSEGEGAIPEMFRKLAAELGMAPHRVLNTADRQEKKALKGKLEKLQEQQNAAEIQKIKAELAAFDDKEVTLSFGLDVEGHLDERGRPVALDFARVFSPEHIVETKHLSTKTPGSIFVRHLRPELIKEFAETGGEPLSADALSSFADETSDRSEMNGRVKKATEFLLDKIPRMAKEMDDTADHEGPKGVKRGAEISRVLHAAGINVRHMGLVYHFSKNVQVRASLLQEMVARTAKNLLRHAARDLVQRSGRADVTAVQKLYTKLLNLLLHRTSRSRSARFMKGGSPLSVTTFLAPALKLRTETTVDAEFFQRANQFWEADVWNGLCLRFGSRSQTTRSELRRKALPNLKEAKAFALRLATMLGIRFSEDCMEALRKEDPTQDSRAGSASFFFTSTDIKALDVRVKYMTVVDRVAGELLLLEKDNYRGEATIVPTRLAAAARRRFKAVLSSTPADRDARAQVEELSGLTDLKSRLDKLICFNASTRKSQGLVQMRDEQELWESHPAVVDLTQVASGEEDVDWQWWVDFLRVLLEEGKFKNVSYLLVSGDVGSSFTWQNEGGEERLHQQEDEQGEEGKTETTPGTQSIIIGPVDAGKDTSVEGEHQVSSTTHTAGRRPATGKRGFFGDTGKRAAAGAAAGAVWGAARYRASRVLGKLAHASRRRSQEELKNLAEQEDKEEPGFNRNATTSTMLSLDMLRRHHKLGGTIRIETLKVGRGSGLLWALSRMGSKPEPILEVELVESMDGMTKEADLRLAIKSLRQVSYDKIRFSSAKFFGDIGQVQWKASLRELYLEEPLVTGKLSQVQWPAALQKLSLKGKRDRPMSITGELSQINWPEPIKEEAKGQLEEQPEQKGLQVLELYNTKISGDLSNVKWPVSLQTIDLWYCGGVTGDLSHVHWPAGLKVLALYKCEYVTGDLSEIRFPEGLLELDLGKTNISGDLGKIYWPPSLKTLRIDGCRQVYGALSPQIIRLGQRRELGGNGMEYKGPSFELPQDLSTYELRVMELRKFYPKGDLSTVTRWPVTHALEELDLSGCAEIVGDLSEFKWPAGLKVLKLAACERITGNLSHVKWPSSLQALDLSGNYPSQMEVGGDPTLARWPQELRKLDLQRCGKIKAPRDCPGSDAMHWDSQQDCDQLRQWISKNRQTLAHRMTVAGHRRMKSLPKTLSKVGAPFRKKASDGKS